MGKLIVIGRITKGMILKTVFMAFRLGLSTPDSAPNCKKQFEIFEIVAIPQKCLSKYTIIMFHTYGDFCKKKKRNGHNMLSLYGKEFL